jgi:hypothetical protein
LAVGPFAAVLAYLIGAALTPREDLGRPDPAPEPGSLRPPLPPVPPPAPRSSAPLQGPAASLRGVSGTGSFLS